MKTKLVLFFTCCLVNYSFAQNFNKIDSIGSDGVMEIGKYIDFHSTNAGTSDYDVRLNASPSKLTIISDTLFLERNQIQSTWNHTYLQWVGHSLVMGSPVGNYMHNRIEFKPGGSSLGQCESALEIFNTKIDLTSESKVKFSTEGTSYVLGNLGVNTTTPSFPLDVNGNIRGSNDLILGSNNKQFILHTQQQLPSNPPILIFAPKKSDGSDFDWTKQIVFQNDGSLLMSSGNLGVGTTTTTSPLSVGDSYGVKLSVGNSSLSRSSILTTLQDLNFGGDCVDLTAPGYSNGSGFLRLSQKGNLFLYSDQSETSGWGLTHFFWKGQSLIMGSPKNNYAHNRIELKPGGSSNGDLESELEIFRTKSNFESESKIKLSTWGTSYISGILGIGTTNPQYTLDVNGTIRAKEVLVNLDGGADFVFEDNYKLKNINELSEYVKENKHLPDVPAAADMVKNGVDMGEFQVKLLQKVEELTLYTIQQQKEIQSLRSEIENLKNK